MAAALVLGTNVLSGVRVRVSPPVLYLISSLRLMAGPRFYTAKVAVRFCQGVPVLLRQQRWL